METIEYSSVASSAKLVIMELGTVRTFELSERTKWSLGRANSQGHPDIALSSAIVSRDHGDFLCLDRVWYYCFHGSTNATFINGTQLQLPAGVTAIPTALQNGDVIRIDYSNLNTPDLNGVMILFLTDQTGDNWEYFPLECRPQTFIGRDEEICQLVQPLPHISAQHACILYRNGQYLIVDCNSRAGTWVNNAPVYMPQPLREKDKISICDCHFIFTGDGLFYNRRSAQDGAWVGGGRYAIEANIRSKVVPDYSGNGYKELVRNININIRYGSLVALLGGSGAGKSTVMNAMVGTDQQGVDGRILFRGEDLYSNFDRLKYLIGSVPQKNEIHEMLSVEEELREAAILRLPADTKRREIKARVEETLRLLNLTAVAKSKISKLSGGEQKRVNIGIELVADRAILCLDEPDAGLDPASKKELLTILRNLADEQKKSILVIIHDVAEIDLFDQVILLAKMDNVGRLAFSGSPADARAYFGVDNLKDAYRVIAEDPRRFIRG